jgi:uncharacterized protein
MLTFFYLFIAGILGGFLAGLVGIGGGVIYVFIIPIALRLIGVPPEEIPQYTIANSIFAILFASASANYVLIRLRNFYYKEVFIIGALGVVSSFFTLRYIVNTPWYSLTIFNVIIILLLMYMLYATLLSARKVYVTPLETLKSWKLNLIGLAGGAIAALSGLGGGIIIIPILNSLLKIDIKKASSISSGVIMITAFTMTIYNMWTTPMNEFHYYNSGYIIFPICLSITAGVIFASPFGVNVARKINSSTISYIYSVFLLLVIMKKIVELYFVA